jgi:hypothetical protein
MDAVTGFNPVVTNRYIQKKVSFKDVLVIGSPALDVTRRNLLGRAWHKVTKRTAAALDAVTDEFISSCDKFVLSTRTFALATQRRFKGAAHKVDKMASQWSDKVVVQAKEVSSACDSKVATLKTGFSKMKLFGR